MVGIGNVPEKGPASAYLERERAVLSQASERGENTVQTDHPGAPKASSGKCNGIRQDRIEWLFKDDTDGWQEQAVRMLEQLKKQYPGITFHLTEDKDAGELASLAVEAGKGIHLYLSAAFAHRMGSSREEFIRCYSALVTAAKTLWAEKDQNLASGAFLGETQVSYWSVAGQPDKEPAKELIPGAMGNGRDGTASLSGDPAVRVSIPLNVAAHFSKMARARTKGQVREAMWDVHRAISSLRVSAVYGDDEQRVKASRALRSLQKLLSRGGRKVRRLDREQLKQQSRKKAEKQHQERRALRLRQEQKRMRAARLGADAALVKEGHGDAFYIQAYRKYAGLGGREEYPFLTGTMAGALESGSAGGEGMSGASDAGFTAAEVRVSDPVNIL